MIRVAAITSGKNIPSSRFRVRQHIEPLKGLGIDVREYVPVIDKYSRFPGLPASLRHIYVLPLYALWEGCKVLNRVPGVMGSWKAQITWLEREMSPGYLTLEPLLKHPYVFDVDDAIWLWPPFGRLAINRVVRNAEVVLAGNGYIANWLCPYAREVQIVPTAVDTQHFTPRKPPDARCNRRFVVGWTGISGNYEYLYRIERALEDFFTQTHDAELLIIADKPPRFSRLRPERVRFVQWSQTIEAEVLREMDVGIMPLPRDEWTLGKCSFKMLQYMASGLPVVVSPVGMNSELLGMGEIGFPATDEADWLDALNRLYKDRGLAYELGARGRKIVEESFSREIVSARLARIFEDLA